MVEEAIELLKQQTGIITKTEDWGEERYAHNDRYQYYQKSTE